MSGLVPTDYANVMVSSIGYFSIVYCIALPMQPSSRQDNFHRVDLQYCDLMATINQETKISTPLKENAHSCSYVKEYAAQGPSWY